MLRPAVGRVALSVALLFTTGAASLAQSHADWPVYNGGKDGDHYSPLRQINRTNVDRLRVAWTFDTGEKGGIQTNPLIIGGTLYAFTPSLKVIALDAATGKRLWTFNPGLGANGSGGLGFAQPSRGLAYWTDGKDSRLFAGIVNYVFCLDPHSGQAIGTFAEYGRLDLRKGLREPSDQQSIALTSPAIVFKDMIIVGGREPETHPAPPGDIRAFDVHTGKLRWIFHTIPHPGEPGYETWPPDAWKTAGSANNWAGMTLDESRGILYAPTGSAVMDFYGGDRIGDDLYANSLLAIDANTGKLVWHFQGVHHDIWDRDFPSPPALFTVKRGGKTIPAIAQTSKQGYLYLFDRLNGKPLYPISERPYPPSTVPGEDGLEDPAAAGLAPAFCPPAPHRRHARPHARRRPTPGPSKPSMNSAATASSSPSAWTSKPSSFPVLTAARSGAARPSIQSTAFFTSTPMRWSGPAASQRFRAAARASVSIASSAPSVTASIAPALRRSFRRWSGVTEKLPARKNRCSRSAMATAACPRSQTSMSSGLPRLWITCAHRSNPPAWRRRCTPTPPRLRPSQVRRTPPDPRSTRTSAASATASTWRALRLRFPCWSAWATACPPPRSQSSSKRAREACPASPI